MRKETWFSKLDKKKLIKNFTLVWGLILIVIMTITNIGLNEEFHFKSWAGDTLIILGIIVFGMFMGESFGDDAQKGRVDGLFQIAVSEFNTVIKELKDLLMYFIQFFGWFAVQELFDKKINYLVMNNITQANAKKIVKYLAIADVPALLTRPIEKIDDETGETIRIGKINEEQADAVREVLLGKIKLNASNPSYYMSAYGGSNNKSVLEQGKHYEELIKFNKRASRGIKLTSSILIAVVLGLLSVKDFMNGNDVQAWVNLVTRITALITSLFSGWMSSVEDIKLKALQINNKVTVLQLFKNAYEKKLFVPLNEEELILQELTVIEEEQHNNDVELYGKADTVESEETANE